MSCHPGGTLKQQAEKLLTSRFAVGHPGYVKELADVMQEVVDNAEALYAEWCQSKLDEQAQAVTSRVRGRRSRISRHYDRECFAIRLDPVDYDFIVKYMTDFPDKDTGLTFDGDILYCMDMPVIRL
jgi:hypothetical protein